MAIEKREIEQMIDIMLFMTRVLKKEKSPEVIKNFKDKNISLSKSKTIFQKSSQCLAEIGKNVVDIFHAGTHADEAVGDSVFFTLFFSHTIMCHGCRMA